MKKISLVILYVLFFSCTSKKQIDFEYINLSTISNTPLIPKVIYNSDSLYITEVEIVNDSILAVIQRLRDKSIMLLNINSSTVESQIGDIGHGPKDVIDPSFIPNLNYENNVLVHDINSEKILTINYKNRNTDSILQLIEYPHSIHPASGLSQSEEYYIGRKIDPNDESLFYLYNTHNNNISKVEQPIHIDGLTDPNYYLASKASINTKQKSIISGMFYIDLIHIYDLNSNLKKSISFSEESIIPKVNKKNGHFDFSNGYKGVNRVYPTEDFCFLRRDDVMPIISNGELVEIKTSSIIKMDWEGNVLNNYLIRDNLIGLFCVDKSNENIFAIRTYLDGDNEYFEVVAYKLN